jgi:hypothetical protein
LKPITAPENPLVLRTDFSNQKVWEAVCKTIRKPVGLFRFLANVDFFDDPAITGFTKDQLLAWLAKGYGFGFIFVVDQTTIDHPEHPLLVMDTGEPGRAFRALPTQIQGIENNLSLANMDFEEFAGAVDADGIFRGFDGPDWL